MKHSYDPVKLFLLIFGVFTFGAAAGLPFPIWIIAIIFLARMTRTDRSRDSRRRRRDEQPDYRRRSESRGYERSYDRRSQDTERRERDRVAMERRRQEQQKRSEQQRRIAKSIGD